jgi:hypothetical protein
VREDQDPPAVVVVEGVEKKKDDAGKEETVGKARVLQAVLGVRDRGQHRVEILELIDPEKKEKVSIADAKFITEGGHGLEADDPVKIEDEHEEKKDEKKEEK